MKRGIVSYDIAVTKYRTELSKILKFYGERIQLSVFEFEVTNSEYSEMIMSIKQFYSEYISHCRRKCIDDKRRSIRVYLLCESCSKSAIFMDDNKNSKKDGVIII